VVERGLDSKSCRAEVLVDDNEFEGGDRDKGCKEFAAEEVATRARRIVLRYKLASKFSGSLRRRFNSPVTAAATAASTAASTRLRCCCALTPGTMDDDDSWWGPCCLAG